MTEIQTKLEELYGKGVIEYNGTSLQLEPGISDLFESSRDPKVLSEVWVKWRDVTGKKMANLYTEYVELQNTGAIENGTVYTTFFNSLWYNAMTSCNIMLQYNAMIWQPIYNYELYACFWRGFSTIYD